MHLSVMSNNFKLLRAIYKQVSRKVALPPQNLFFFSLSIKKAINKVFQIILYYLALIIKKYILSTYSEG